MAKNSRIFIRPTKVKKNILYTYIILIPVGIYFLYTYEFWKNVIFALARYRWLACQESATYFRVFLYRFPYGELAPESRVDRDFEITRNSFNAASEALDLRYRQWMAEKLSHFNLSFAVFVTFEIDFGGNL